MNKRLSVAEIERGIEDEVTALTFLTGKQDRLRGEMLRADNAVCGLSGEEGEFVTIGRKEEAAQMAEKAKQLSRDLAAVEAEVEERQANLSTLKVELAAAAPTEKMRARQCEYVALAESYREMEKRRVDLGLERERSTVALSNAVSALNNVQIKRAQALSLDDVSAASKLEGAAQARKADIEGLMANIEAAQVKLVAEMDITLARMEQVKRGFFEGSADVGVQTIQQHSSFLEIKDQVEKAFAASILAEPYGSSFSQFLLRIFSSQDGMVEGGTQHLNALQDEVAASIEAAC